LESFVKRLGHEHLKEWVLKTFDRLELPTMRLRQDLQGCANRIRAAQNDLSEQSQLLQEAWRDDRGEDFIKERIVPASARLLKLTHALQAAGELAQQFDKKLFDPGMG
jgi:hypothetical protein